MKRLVGESEQFTVFKTTLEDIVVCRVRKMLDEIQEFDVNAIFNCENIHITLRYLNHTMKEYRSEYIVSIPQNMSNKR